MSKTSWLDRKIYLPKTGITEQEAFARLERATRDIVKRARWNSLGLSKIHELRQPLAELTLSRRAARKTTIGERNGKR